MQLLRRGGNGCKVMSWPNDWKIRHGSAIRIIRSTRLCRDCGVMMSDFAANSSHVVDFMNNSPNWQGSSDSVRSVFYPHMLFGRKQLAAILHLQIFRMRRIPAAFHPALKPCQSLNRFGGFSAG